MQLTCKPYTPIPILSLPVCAQRFSVHSNQQYWRAHWAPSFRAVSWVRDAPCEGRTLANPPVKLPEEGQSLVRRQRQNGFSALFFRVKIAMLYKHSDTGNVRTDPLIISITHLSSRWVRHRRDGRMLRGSRWGRMLAQDCGAVHGTYLPPNVPTFRFTLHLY